MKPRFTTYDEAIQFLIGRINYERISTTDDSAAAFKLERITRLLAACGHPEQRLPAAHVAGTKGKGSTCTMLAATLTAAGYRAGLYTSPHLTRFEERFTVEGRQPDPNTVLALVNQIAPLVATIDTESPGLQPTYFELATALAWLHFLDQHADIAVLETGLGGRLDSTNVCQPLVTGLTSISRDHMQILGDTITLIAREKAGILKTGVPAISGALHPEAMAVIQQTAREKEAPLWQLGPEIRILSAIAPDRAREETGWLTQIATPARTWPAIRCPLRGEHQTENLAVVLGMVDALIEQGWKIQPHHVTDALRNVVWPARIEVVGSSPTVILDASHNAASASALAKTLTTDFPCCHRILVFASSRDKEVVSALEHLLPLFDTIIVTQFLENPRAISPEELQTIAQQLTTKPVTACSTPQAAWSQARSLATTEDQIVITGSFFLVAELRHQVLEDCRHPEL